MAAASMAAADKLVAGTISVAYEGPRRRSVDEGQGHEAVPQILAHYTLARIPPTRCTSTGSRSRDCRRGTPQGRADAEPRRLLQMLDN